MYNAQDYIAEALDSVLAQTFEDFECLVMDDGSSDASRKIVQDYARADTRITLLSQPKSGIVTALNQLILAAQGRYLVRFDSDDVCYPERFATQLDYFRRDSELAILGSKVALIGEQQGTWHYRQTDEQTRALQLVGNTCLCTSLCEWCVATCTRTFPTGRQFPHNGRHGLLLSIFIVLAKGKTLTPRQKY